MNGKQDYTYQVLNFIINPREQSNMSSTCLSVMWSCDSYITNSKTWPPNHFAPLLKEISASQEFDLDNNEDRGRSDDNGVGTNYDVCIGVWVGVGFFCFVFVLSVVRRAYAMIVLVKTKYIILRVS